MAGQWSGGTRKERAPRERPGRQVRSKEQRPNQPEDEWGSADAWDQFAPDEPSFESEWAFGDDEDRPRRQPRESRPREGAVRRRDGPPGRAVRSRRDSDRRDRSGSPQRSWPRGRTNFSPTEQLTELQELKRSGKDFVYGVSPVLSALVACRRDMHTLHVQETINPSARKDRAAIERIEALAKDANVLVKRTDKGTLNVLADSRPHQGFVLETEPLEYTPKDQMHFPSTDGVAECWLVLDEIHDPQNLGALIRTAYFLGVTGVVACAKNSSSLSPVVSKASAGSMELMELYAAPSLPKFLRTARESGWRVVGAAMDDDAIPCKEMAMDEPTLLVLGNEGRGLRPLVRNACSHTVRIGGTKQDYFQSEVDSLNVSVAGGVLLHQLLGK